MNRALSNILFIFLIATSWLIAFYALNYFAALLIPSYWNLLLQGGREDTFFKHFVGLKENYRGWFALHTLGGGLALLLGPFQFFPKIRRRHLLWHKALGLTYFVCIWAGGIGAARIAPHAMGGWISASGFMGLACLWLATATVAYRHLMQGRYRNHGQWMIVNFSLTFAAVTLRLEMPFLQMLFGTILGYQIVAWSCWLPNLVVAWFAWGPGRR